MVKDPVCGMNVNEKPPSSNQSIWVKHTISAANHVRKLSIKTQLSMWANRLRALRYLSLG